MAMTKIERVQAASRGDPVDRPPYSFWFHYGADQVAGRAAAEAHLATYRRFDQDILKVMNDNGYDTPGGVAQPASAKELACLPPAPLESECYQNQLECLRIIRDELGGECHVLTTFFHPLNIAEKLTGGRMVDFLQDDRDNALAGLGHIAKSQARFATACIEAGADGIFISCQDSIDLALGAGFYAEHIAAYDRVVLAGAAGASLNTLHLHGKMCDFDSFLDYPVAAINWADRASGPAIDAVKSRMRQTIFGGMDHVHTITSGDPAALTEEIRGAAGQAQGHGFIVGPGCSFPSDTPEAMLAAVGETCKAMAG